MVARPVRLNTSALVGDPDPYPQVFQIQNAIPGSVWVSATGWLGAVSQNLRVLEYLRVLSILNRIKLVNCKHQYVEQNTFWTSCHTVTKPNMARSATRFLPSIRSLPLTPNPIKHKQAQASMNKGRTSTNKPK